MFKAFFFPAIWALNRMNFAAKFVFMGLLLLAPFAYVTLVMRRGTDKQLVFNRKESYGVDYIAPAFRLLSRVQDCRTYSAALLSGDTSFAEPLEREQRAAEALLPAIDAVDAKYREDFRTEDGAYACSQRWAEIKNAWIQSRELTSPEESYTRLGAMIADWILYVANHSNLILDPDLDSYWLMDAFVQKVPRITESMSQACARGLHHLSERAGASPQQMEDRRLEIHGLRTDALETLQAFVDVNLKSAYDYNGAKGGTLRPRMEEPAQAALKSSLLYLDRIQRDVVKGESDGTDPRALVDSCRGALDATRRLYEAIGPELNRLILARVDGYKQEKTLGMIAAETATFLHVYLFIAFYLAVHASVAKVAGFTRRMVEGTKERFALDSRDELGTVAASFNRINELLNQTRDLKDQVERRGEDLKASEERFRTLAARAPVGIFLADADGRCVYVNERWCALTSETPEEATGQEWTRAVHADDLERVRRDWRAAAEGGATFSSEFRCNGGREVVWLSGNGVVLRDRTGKVTGYLGSATDITEQKRVERLKNEFISTVSHELRTPLTSIRGSLGLITGGVTGPLPPKAKAMIDIAKKNCERLVRLVSDILDIEKIESGKMVFDIRPTDLVPLLEQAVEANRGYAQSLGIGLELDNAVRDVRVLVDADRMIQVVTNLLSNASKFSPEGGVVRVRVSRRGDQVRVSVLDQGAGIPEEFRPRIFQKFAQADGSDGRAKQGTGLGLSICKAIVERMGGRIGFESEIGQGTTFYFDVPAQSRPSPSGATRHPDRASVLVCEDDEDIAAILRGILEGQGYNVDVATSAAEVRTCVRNNRYAGMTLDLALPDQDGISLVRELREDPVSRYLPIVIVSAYIDEGRKSINGDLFGILDWLEKPIDEGRLKRALARTAERFEGRKPRVLHVEDDDDIVEVVETALSDRAEVVRAKSLADARPRIRNEKYDLLILDIGLPDGSGLELLPALRGSSQAATPVVIFSAQEVSAKTAGHVQAALVKSKTSNEEFVDTINAILGNPVYCANR